jgi:FkbM family methyltransferase
MFISYASNFEDVLLQRVFQGMNDGFYIDIGADHPVSASTTKAFYDRGWRGVNVEPGPNFEMFQASRPRDVNVKAAVTDRDGQVDFFINDDLTATSSVFESMHPSVSGRVANRTKVTVESVSLNTLVEKHAPDEVHFLNIDAEGSEGAIIMAADWRRFRPHIILAESTEPFSTKRVDGEWCELLKQNGFLEVYFDGINTWFVRKESEDIARHFEIPVNLLDDFIDYEKSLLRAHLKQITEASAVAAQARPWYRRMIGLHS